MASADTGKQQLKVFISYSRKDIATANAIADALEAQGFDVLIDRRDLPYGEQWQTELADLIRQSDAVVWLVSQSSCISRWCNWELGEVMRLGKRLLPVTLEAMTSNDLPEAIGKIQLLPNEGTFEIERHLGTLKFVLETNSAWLKEHTRLADRARQWIAKGRRRDLLLTGTQLREAQGWLDARRETSPMPGAETLELMLASRRAKARKRVWWTVGPILASCILFAAYVGIMIAGTVRLSDTSLAMNDIVNSDGDTGFVTSYGGCRMRCIFSVFNQPCVAFSYDMSPGNPKTESSHRRCFPKYAADFYWNPSKTGSEAAITEIMATFVKPRPRPSEMPFQMRWNRGLSGEPVKDVDVLALTDATYISDPGTGRTSWSFDGTKCQQTCLALGDKCKGFSYTSLSNRCELFKSVRGVLREKDTGKPVFMPATVAACDDSDAAIDPVTNDPDCPPRLSLMNPQRKPPGPAPAESSQ